MTNHCHSPDSKDQKKYNYRSYIKVRKKDIKCIIVNTKSTIIHKKDEEKIL